jgi:hypothetical protein
VDQKLLDRTSAASFFNPLPILSFEGYAHRAPALQCFDAGQLIEDTLVQFEDELELLENDNTTTTFSLGANASIYFSSSGNSNSTFNSPEPDRQERLLHNSAKEAKHVTHKANGAHKLRNSKVGVAKVTKVVAHIADGVHKIRDNKVGVSGIHPTIPQSALHNVNYSGSTASTDSGNSSFVSNSLRLRLFHEHRLPLETVFRGCYPLAPQAFKRSLKTDSVRDVRLQRVIQAARQSRHVIVAVVGGPVACGTAAEVEKLHDKLLDGKCHVDKSSSSLFVAWLRHRYPNASFAYTNLAVGGTTSPWLLSHLHALRDANPDIVLYDYGTNDQKDDLPPHLLRSTTEAVTRAVYNLPSRPCLIQLSLFRDTRSGVLTARLENDGILPVAILYNYTVVSYTSAVWPASALPAVLRSGLFDSFGIHLMWYVHQIIADLFAYSWAVAESTLTEIGGCDDKHCASRNLLLCYLTLDLMTMAYRHFQFVQNR